MDKTNKVPDKKRTDILFSLSEPGGIGTAKLIGVLNHPMKKGIIFTTDYPLEQGHVLSFHEEIRGHQFGVVRRVLNYGKTYMAQIDLRKRLSALSR